MKKISIYCSMILALTLLAFCLTGCDESDTVTTFETSEVANESESSTPKLASVNDSSEVEISTEETKETQPAKMVGTYKSNDGSTVIITENGGTYKANISIYKLMNVTLSGTISGDTITLSGPDPNGGKFGATITGSDSGIKLTFTSSTWQYINEGVTFNFSK